MLPSEPNLNELVSIELVKSKHPLIVEALRAATPTQLERGAYWVVRQFLNERRVRAIMKADPGKRSDIARSPGYRGRGRHGADAPARRQETKPAPPAIWRGRLDACLTCPHFRPFRCDQFTQCGEYQPSQVKGFCPKEKWRE